MAVPDVLAVTLTAATNQSPDGEMGTAAGVDARAVTSNGPIIEKAANPDGTAEDPPCFRQGVWTDIDATGDEIHGRERSRR